MARPVAASVFALIVACSSAPTLPPVDSRFGPPPEVPDGRLDEEVEAALDRSWSDYPEFDPEDLEVMAESGDPRLAWLLADYLRFNLVGDTVPRVQDIFERLTGLEMSGPADWVEAVDTLMGWDVPSFDGYLDYKRQVFVAADPRWEPFFTDESDIDYRLWTWGGVFIDDSPPRQSQSCQGCIPGLDDPRVTTADDGDWYPDDRLVMGVVIDGEARAYPRNIMEVHEMVNDTLGGRDFALPYCTLCGSAQLYFTDDLDGERPYLRTSGLLSRSNKVMYDVVSGSVFDTFTGRAVAGPLWEQGIELNQGTVVTTSWGEWKGAHPETTIVELELGAGRNYPLDPLGDRDAAGPIFPVGRIDDRLGAHETVLGVLSPDGSPVAFPVEAARKTLEAGGEVAAEGVTVELDSGGLSVTVDGSRHPSHQAFWFAWSQFHPDTVLWDR